MATYRILVPAGIGDFSWLWTRLSVTADSFIVEYSDATPDRLAPFLALLPKNKIKGYGKSNTHRCTFNVGRLEMTFSPADGKRITRYSELNPDILNHVEPNTHLERGGRIENWLPDIKSTNFHYRIEGLLENPKPQNYFIVHLSSTHTFRIWRHYDFNDWIKIFDMMQRKTGLLPIFIGGEYDDFARQCCEQYMENHNAVNLIGKTPDLLSTLCLVQQCKFFFGAVSSGMTMLANVLKVPSASYWPREKLPQSWNAPNVPYTWLMWKNPEQDLVKLEQWVTSL